MTPSPKPKRFIVTLTEEQHERLELHRVALGKRDWAGVVRHWIDEEPQGANLRKPSPEDNLLYSASSIEAGRVDKSDPKPASKPKGSSPGLHGTRLKGVWKAP